MKSNSVGAIREAMRHIDDSEARLKKVLERAENARKASEAAAPLVEAIKADLAGRETARAKLMAQDSAARARLRYLAGIDPAGELNLELPPLDQPKWINGDLSPAACADQATAQGPGVVAADTLVAFDVEATNAPIETLLAESDWVSLQLPRGEGTVGFLNAERLAMMKPEACLINTAQANQVDRAALIDALLWVARRRLN